MLQARFKEDMLSEAGIDEAGRGCFWGPLMAAAVVWPAESEWDDTIRALAPQIRDSKKISPKKRAAIAAAIRKHAQEHSKIHYGIGSVSAEELDSYGVTWANQTAFQRAVAQISPRPQRLLIDGVLACTYEHGEVHTIVDGDATFLSIAAASILAKEAHDDWVREFCEAEPEIAARYSLASCKGYGTAKHREGLRIHGAHQHHRQRFINGGGSKEGGYNRKEREDKCLIAVPTIKDDQVFGI
jgi:ribonuclease HII